MSSSIDTAFVLREIAERAEQLNYDCTLAQIDSDMNLSMRDGAIAAATRLVLNVVAYDQATSNY